jgi:hypothetical protein
MRRAVIYLQYHYTVTIFDVLWEHDAIYYTLLRLNVECTSLAANVEGDDGASGWSRG